MKGRWTAFGRYRARKTLSPYLRLPHVSKKSMNPQASALLADPHPAGHIVYSYRDKNLVYQAVSLYASAGLRNGEAVILIMRRANYEAITGRLWQEGFDVQALQRTGRLTCLIAEEVLSRFMVDGVPNGTKFNAIIAEMIHRAGGSFPKDRALPPIRAFGEMVCLLWVTNLAAAAALENMWNAAIKTYGLSLLCSYQVAGSAPITLPPELLACHAHNLG